jgi:predicted MFS family arabinose efflux permease
MEREEPAAARPPVNDRMVASEPVGTPLPDGSTPSGPTSTPSFRRALASRPFFLLWTSQLVSQSGDFVFDVALLWLVLEQTGSVVAVSIVVVAAIVPSVTLGPVLGVYVDRWPRRTILLTTNLAEGGLVAAFSGLVLAHATNLALIVGVVFALGVGQQFVRVTSGAMTPQTVEKADLATANSLETFSSSTTQIAGLSVGGAVVALFGVTLPIVYDAASFFAAALIVLAMSAAIGRPMPVAEGAPARFTEQFAEGFRYVAGQRFLLEVIAIGVVVNFAGNAAFAMWAPYARYVVHGGAATYGLLGAMIALGSVIGALVVGKVDVRAIAGPLIFGGLFAFGALILGLGLTHSVGPALAEAFAIGGFTAGINVPIFTVVQGKVPERLTGRVISVLLALVLAAAPFGAYFAGVFAQATSIGFLYVAMGILVLVTATVAFATMREVRTLTY